MTIPATAQEIYDLLLTDEVISDRLGVYLLPGGQELPAISVLAANEQLPPGTSAAGLEITITAMPGYAPQSLMGFEALLNPTWRIYVIAWDQLGDLQVVAERVLALLPAATAARLQRDPPGEGLGVVDQIVVTWTNPCTVMETA